MQQTLKSRLVSVSKKLLKQEIKGYEVELAMNEASIQTLEDRISLIQDEISIVRSDLEALKNEEEASRDGFIDKMIELNTKIRKFQEAIACAFHNENQIGTSSNDAGSKLANAKDIRRSLEDKLAQIISQTSMEEQEYQAEQQFHKQVQLGVD
ncbi:hypothetical protein F0562_004701 [Nyssa sinensis]|uniref:Uncharacterized protein n=1 Tax=Nyssa sinensis TaxID=561372 RepID=A0A5J5BYM0_9ASTE|nr:hypothetical protein F0562_004701 [Nyssa sinensis]